MRYIDNRGVEPPNDDWQVAADNAKDAVADGGNTNDHGQVWRDCKNMLAGLSAEKCWYCEAIQERSDDAVDHFRPKGKVSSCEPEHHGYKWLTFELSNFRFSCTFCNSKRRNPESGDVGGKGSEFPLIDEAVRAQSHGCNLENESPVLLDPCNASDPPLLLFREDGIPYPRYPNHTQRRQRVEESIRLYHLDHQGAVDARKVIATNIRSWIHEGSAAFPRTECGDAMADTNFSGRVRDIAKAIAPSAPYSAFAKDIVKGLATEEWVEALL